jgi:mono/diheme cytochrome c family protein
MRDKVVLGITLAVVLMVTLAIYGAVDINRGPSTALAQRSESVANGTKIFAQYCIQCHGPLGEGCIGPALNKPVFRKEINGAPNPEYEEGTGHDFIKKTVERGRPSNQPGIQMPPWSTSENGPLNDEQIEDVTNFILYGDWAQVLENANSAIGLGEDLPAYPGFDDKAKLAQVKQLMLEKGCLNCHTMGKGGGQVAAILSEVGSRRTADWLRKWIKNPKSVPPTERGPNLWLIAPTPSLETPGPNSPPTATPIAFQMNETFMPTIPMTEAELNLIVDYLSHAKIAKK